MDPTIQLLQAVTAASRTGEAAPLRLGQVLAATAVAVAQGQVTLHIGNRTVAAATQVPLELGQRLNLEVTRLQPQVLLRVIPEARPADPLTSARAQLLPRQGGLVPLLANALHMAATTGVERPWLAALRKLVEQLPERPQLATRSGLQRGVAGSGLFLEARLAAGQPPEPNDLKGQLLRLLQLLPESPPGNAAAAERPPAPPQAHALPSPQAAALTAEEVDTPEALLKQSAEGALARLTLHQMATAQTQREGESTWLLELPLRNGPEAEVLPLRIRREGSGASDEAEQARWTVQLALDLPGLGPLHARVTLQGERVGSLFWAEQPDTRKLVQSHLEMLRERLAEQGLRVGELDCLAGRPPQPPAPEGGAPLLDERA